MSFSFFPYKHKIHFRSIRLDPNYSKAVLRYAKCCLCLGKIEEARSACLAARNLEPMSADLPHLVGFYSKYQICTPIVRANRSVTTDLRKLQKTNHHSGLAICALVFKLNKIFPGSSSYHKMYRDSPGFSRLWFEANRRTASTETFHRGQTTDRVSCFVLSPRFFFNRRIILRNNEASAELLYYRGLCLFYLDHVDKAISHFQHVLRLHPDHVETQHAYKRAKTLLKLKEIGNKFIHDRRFSRACETYTEALNVDPLHDAMNAKLLCNRACAKYNVSLIFKSRNNFFLAGKI